MLLHPLSDLRSRAIIPRCLAQDSPRDRVPGLGDPAGSNGATATVLAGCQSEIRNKLARVRKSCEVADLSDDRRSNNRTDALESLQRCQQWRPM